MKKVLDKDLERRINGIIEDGGKASEVVMVLKGLQDAGGVKICQNISKEDPAYKEVK